MLLYSGMGDCPQQHQSPIKKISNQLVDSLCPVLQFVNESSFILESNR